MNRILIVFLLAVSFVAVAGTAYAEIKYVKSYNRSDGTYVSGHYKDTSGDGNRYNNANYLGLND
ncbi:MAG TPA: hypothetical protein VD998_03735 [Verrucomicrobiae bacterium]|nr:hypothetical protein [Verrucomicrobiae bacterium]